MKEIKKLKAIRIGFLGNSCVGKASICNTYTLGHPYMNENLTIEISNKYENKFKLKNGDEIKLVLVDTRGQERFRSVLFGTIRHVNGIVIIFDVSNKASFEDVVCWQHEIRENGKNCYGLFGNKVDIDKKNWKISTEEAKKYAEENNLPYFETSCKTGQGIKEGIDYIANLIYVKESMKIENNINIKKEEIKDKSNCVG